MCRIAGMWYHPESNRRVDVTVLNKMRDSVCYGGPDAADSFINEKHTLGLGHRRLSIIDLSPDANQPQRFENLYLIFNGEMYNYAEVKKELLPLNHVFKTKSDTEVLLHAWKEWGVDCLSRFRGMFAFAIWDDQNDELILCRDRVGVKPLYWYFKDDLFMFASELKAFHEHPQFDKSINHSALPGFLKRGYIQTPLSIYKFVHKLEPGSVLKLSRRGSIEKIKYWDIKKIYSQTDIQQGSDENLTDTCENILKESFDLRMVSDVPVGIFLSGGIDSTLVTALLQKDNDTPLKTFTIGFNEPEYNEATHAKKIAEHLGTDHYELYCSEKEFTEVLLDYFYIYDEPFGDNSGIPTYLVSRMAKQQVKVTLSADGGDEIFAGYLKYSANYQYYNKIKKVPVAIRGAASRLMTSVGHERAVQLFNRLPWTSGIGNLEWRMSKILNAVKARNAVEFQDLISNYISDQALIELLGSNGEASNHKHVWPMRDQLTYSLLGAMDITTYLEGDILTKVDRATMQNAIEGREPFLDQNIIEFAMGLPDHMKMRNGETKWILRQILSKYVPKNLWERPKQGFAIPTKKWLNTILSDELDRIYTDSNFMECFQLRPLALKKIIVNFKTSATKQENPYLVWFLYCLYGWYKRWC